MGCARVYSHHAEVHRRSAGKTARGHRFGFHRPDMEAVHGDGAQRRLLSRQPVAPRLLGGNGSADHAESHRRNRLANGTSRFRKGEACVPPAHHPGPRPRYAYRFFAGDRGGSIYRPGVRLIRRRPDFPVQEHPETDGCRVRKDQGISAVTPIAIIGAGGWGTALAITMARAEHDVRLWAYEPYLVETMIATRENPIYLPSVRVPESVRVSNSMQDVLAGARIVIMAVPSHVYRRVFSQLLPWLNGDMFFVSAAKGIENDSLMRMSEVVVDVAK